MISSLTSPPASMILLACLPSSVFWAICSRSMSPVARWQTQNSSRIRGACVPLPVSSRVEPSRSGTNGASAFRQNAPPIGNERRGTRTSARRSDEDRAKLLRGRLGPLRNRLCSLLEHANLFVQLRDETLEVLNLAGRCHFASRDMGDEKWDEKWGGGRR